MNERIKNMVRYLRQKLLQVNLYFFSSSFEITGKNILIIAPHPDDETFGCGGLIRKKVAKGAEVNVLFLTNGEKSLGSVPPEEIAQMRKKSATEALKVLGVNEDHLFWLEYPDGAIPRKGSQRFEEAKERVVTVLEKVKAEEVFTPNRLEGWPDHLAACELAVEAVKSADRRIGLYLYWVWAWYYVGVKQMVSLSWRRMHLLSIGDVFRGKQDALQVYFKSKTPDGYPYMGELPQVFLNAFVWQYEVFEKVEIDDI